MRCNGDNTQQFQLFAAWHIDCSMTAKGDQYRENARRIEQ